MTNQKLIKSTGTILANKNINSVFEFFANPSNDNLWRTEIKQSTLGGTLQLGVTVTERSYLSKKVSDNLVKLKCVQFERNEIAIFETPENAQFYQKSQRQVKAISDNITEIIYTLEFDINIVNFALGFTLPKFIVSLKVNSDMKKYLRQLKKQIENY